MAYTQARIAPDQNLQRLEALNDPVQAQRPNVKPILHILASGSLPEFFLPQITPAWCSHSR
jgi:hypothetical protein